MSDLISRQAAIDAVNNIMPTKEGFLEPSEVLCELMQLPSAQPERKKDTIQKFHDYQVEWLKSHYDIVLEPQLEEMIVRFLHDTANCYMMNGGEQE